MSQYQDLSESDRRLNVESRIEWALSSRGGETIVASAAMSRLVQELRVAFDELAIDGRFLPTIAEARGDLRVRGDLRAYADRHHPAAEGIVQPTDYGTGVEYDAVCSGCGGPWLTDEEYEGCDERRQLLADAAEATA